jgi:hypothetical protein
MLIFAGYRRPSHMPDKPRTHERLSLFNLFLALRPSSDETCRSAARMAIFLSEAASDLDKERLSIGWDNLPLAKEKID